METYNSIELTKQLVKDGKISQEIAETIFPELKESEDEKTRKALLVFVKDAKQSLELQERDNNKWQIEQLEIYISWLEKRGENIKFLESIQIGDEVTRNPDGVLVNLSQFKRLAEQTEQNLANSAKTCKVEPKFKVGDKIKYAGQPDRCAEKIIAIRNDAYYFSEVVRLPFIEQDRWELAGQKPSDKVEAKQIQIKEGKWYVCDTSRYTDFAVGKAYYCPKNGMLKPNENEMARYVAKYCFHLWTIQDAKDGDVLADGNLPFIFKKIDTNKHSYAYCGISVDDGFKIESDGESGEWTWMQDIKPATKEQRDVLFRKMKEAGYEWDAEKKELRKIEQKPSIENCPHSIKSKSYLETGYPVEQKPAWSEDDEERLNSIIESYKYLLRDYKACHDVDYIPYNSDTVIRNVVDDVNFLESLKDRVKPQPKQEWSEEDEKMIEFWNLYYEHKVGDMPNKDVVENLEKFRDWLKSLKIRVQPQPKQKWSKEDEISIDEIIETLYIVQANRLRTQRTHYGKATIDKDIAFLKTLKERYAWKPSNELMQVEVKEVDLERYYNEYFKGWSDYNGIGDSVTDQLGICVTLDDIKDACRYFFELGLKVKQG